MDTRGNQGKRQSAKIPKRKKGPENPRIEAGSSRTFEKPKDTQKSCVSRNLEKDAQKVAKKSIYEPIREQFKILLEYLNILDTKRSSDAVTEIGQLLDFMDIMRRKCEVYLNFQLMKAGS
jgi:hypothetical protein